MNNKYTSIFKVLLAVIPFQIYSQELACINPSNCVTWDNTLINQNFRSVSMIDNEHAWIMSNSGTLYKYEHGTLTQSQKIGVNNGLVVDAVNENMAGL